MKNTHNYFSRAEVALWSFSAMLIVLSFFIFDREGYLTLIASLIGVTSLIFCAKGNPIGQALMIVFSVIYGIISFSFDYYGEMVTYLGMTLPMAVFALVSWLRNPYGTDRSEVKVGVLTARARIFMCISAIALTVAFYFILAHFKTANLLPSTLSVTTSFIAAYLTLMRSPFFALAYAANDVILIILWTLASLEDTSYISVVVCFLVFLFNDLYGFVNWRKMKKRQSE